MALATELMAAGIPGGAARMIGSSAETAVTATGTAQGDAYALKASLTVFGTVGSGTGALLPSATGSPPFVISNGGANALSVYPASGEIINGLSANSAFSVTNAKTAIFYPAGNRWVAVLSA
jgi:hypothetical protein